MQFDIPGYHDLVNLRIDNPYGLSFFSTESHRQLSTTNTVTTSGLSILSAMLRQKQTLTHTCPCENMHGKHVHVHA